MLMQNASVSRSGDRSEQEPNRKRRVGLSRAAERQLRNKLRTRCPSAPWIDAQFKSAESIDDRGREVSCRYHDPSVFPPGGAKTLMVRCPGCCIFTPPNAMDGGICLDCQPAVTPMEPHLGWGKSPSALSIERLQYYRGKELSLPLEPESTDDLRREIQRAVKRAEKAERRRKRREKRRKQLESAQTV